MFSHLAAVDKRIRNRKLLDFPPKDLRKMSPFLFRLQRVRLGLFRSPWKGEDRAGGGGRRVQSGAEFWAPLLTCWVTLLAAFISAADRDARGEPGLSGPDPIQPCRKFKSLFFLFVF